MADERLDIVIFGATGFTGKYAVKEAARLAKEEQFTWGVADRCKDTLEDVLKEFAPQSENIRIIIADVKNEESLRKMTEQAKVLVNCCTPFRFYGEPVIKACIATQTHQVDVSTEPQYMETIQLNYNKSARNNGIYIVSACGIEAVPYEMGIIYTQRQFDGDVNSIEAYVNVQTAPNDEKVLFYYDKWLSGVYTVAHLNELKGIRAKMGQDEIPIFGPKLGFKGIVHKTNIAEGWSRLLLSTSVVVGRRTQRFLYENYKRRPIQLQTYMTFKSWWHVLRSTTVGATAYLITRSLYGRSLLLKYPKFFSGGLASRVGPTQEAMEKTRYSIVFYAKGWSNKLSNSAIKRKDPPNKEMVTRFTGVNPEYGISNFTLLLSALMILRDKDKMPDRGGVLTPGAAFERTSMLDQLMNQHGLKFEVVSTAVDK